MRSPIIPKDKSLSDIRIENALDVLLEKPRNRITLRTFENKFLPILAIGGKEQEKVQAILTQMNTNTGDGSKHTVVDIVQNLVNAWIEESCDVRLYTDCYDSRGNIVYVIPPLIDFDSDFGADGADFARITEMADQQSRIHPQMGRQFIQKHLVPLIKEPTPNPEWIKLWNIIFKYHDMPLLNLNGVTHDIEKDEIEKAENDVIDQFTDFG